MKYVLSLIAVALALSSDAQTSKLTPPKIFFNCQEARCYTDYLRAELGYFNIVRDQGEASVQIFITDQTNASGGRLYELNFMGQLDRIGENKLITFTTKTDDTPDIERSKILENVQKGLYHYIADTELEKDVKIVFPKQRRESDKSTEKVDKWNNWIFGIGADGRFEGESNRKAVRTDGFFRGGRTTDESKFSFNTYYNQRTNSVTVDSVENKVLVQSYGFNSLYVKTFSKNWSVGGLVKGYHSIFQNIQFSNSFAPAIEYSVYPVDEFNKRQLRWIYQAGVRKLDYIETTIFDKIEETLPYQQLTGIMGLTQPWGNFSAEMNGYQYLHDLAKYRISLELELRLRVAEGLFLRFYGNGSQIKNQISLAKATSDTSEILLGGSQLPTTLDYFTSFGFNYTFGSMNNSIVNPRFSGVN